MDKAPSKGSLFVVFLTVFIDLLGFAIVLPLLAIYAEDIPGVDDRGWAQGMLLASFSAMQFFFTPLWGRLSDRYGRRPILILGLAGSCIFYALFAVAIAYSSLILLFASRIGAGVAGATISTAQAYIADTTTKEKRAKGMALIGMAFGLGFTLGPLIGFLAVAGGGKPAPTPGIVASVLSGIAMLMAIFVLPESRQPGGEESAHRNILDLAALRAAMQVPSIGMLLLTLFVCVFSFANFETTLAVLIKTPAHSATPEAEDSKVQPDASQPDASHSAGAAELSMETPQIMLTFAYIGLVLSIVQGGLVRRLSGRVSEGKMAAFGAVTQVLAFLLVLWAIRTSSTPILFTALTFVVTGFAFMQPSLNALISRRTDPDNQGGVLGVSQSVSSMARILGAAIGIPMLKYWAQLPYFVAAALMTCGAILVLVAAARGRDFGSEE